MATSEINTTSEPASQYLLKIFSGPHIGAELLLDKGSYDIGHSDDCDIVLNDETVVAKHARIVIDDAGHTVTISSGAQAWLNGFPIGPDTQVTVGPYETVALGTTYLAIGKPGGDWSRVRFPRLLPTEAQNDAEGALYGTVMGKLVQFLHQTADLLNHLNDKLVRGVPWIEYKKYWRGLAAVVVILLAGVIGMHVYSNYLLSQVQGSMVSPAQKISEVLAGHDRFAGVQAAATGTDRVLVYGYVADAAEYQALRELLEPLAIKLDMSVKRGSLMVESAQSLLGVLGLSALQVAYLPHGKIVVDGYVSDRSQWENAKLTLLNDLAGLQAIDDSGVQDALNRRDNLRARLSDQKLSDRLVIASSPDGTLTAKGVLSPGERRRWEKTLNHFRHEFGDKPNIKTTIHDTVQMVDVPIVGVRIGQVAYIVTEDGAKYLQGAVLPSGYKVKNIYSDRIIFSKDDVDVTYQLD